MLSKVPSLTFDKLWLSIRNFPSQNEVLPVLLKIGTILEGDSKILKQRVHAGLVNLICLTNNLLTLGRSDACEHSLRLAQLCFLLHTFLPQFLLFTNLITTHIDTCCWRARCCKACKNDSRLEVDVAANCLGPAKV